MKYSVSPYFWGLLAAILGVTLVIYRPDLMRKPDNDLKVTMDNVLQSLLIQEKKVDVNHKPKIAVGYGACKDVFVEAKDILGHLKPPGELQNFNEIETMDQLLKMFGYFFSHGAAAE